MCISTMLLAQTRHRQDSTMLCRQDTACISTMMLVVQTQMHEDDCRSTSPIAMPLLHHGNVVLTLWCTHKLHTSTKSRVVLHTIATYRTHHTHLSNAPKYAYDVHSRVYTHTCTSILGHAYTYDAYTHVYVHTHTHTPYLAAPHI